MRAILGLLMTLCSIIAHFVATCVRVVYTVLKIFHIRLLALYLCACGIAQLIWKPFSGGRALYFWLGFAACLAVTLLSWIYTVHKQNVRRREERERKQAEQAEKARLKEEKKARKEEKRQRREERKRQRSEPPAPERTARNYPVYFEVAGHPGYVFAEFEDRYDLYYRGAEGLVYVRTDPKPKEEQT